MNKLILIAFGGAIGAVLRFVIGGWLQNNSAFPVGTLIINFTGSLLLGAIMYSAEYAGLFQQDVRVFLTIGFLGAYTTFSTFSFETFKLVEGGNLGLAGVNILASVLSGLMGVYAGRLIGIFLGGIL